MDKNGKKGNVLFLISAIICAVPLIVSLIFYGKIPDELPNNIGMDGDVKYTSKVIIAVVLPALALVLDVVSGFIASLKNKYSNKALSIVFSMPILSMILLADIVYNILK